MDAGPGVKWMALEVGTVQGACDVLRVTRDDEEGLFAGITLGYRRVSFVWADSQVASQDEMVGYGVLDQRAQATGIVLRADEESP